MVRFGVQLHQEEFDLPGMKKAWREVEGLGFESVWIYDHFYPMSQITSNTIFEPYTILPALAVETNSIRFGVMVTCNSYRIPSVLAKIAATIDVISNGRLEFGIGAGWHEGEYKAYGIPFPEAKIRLEQLAEAVEIIKRIWTQEKADFQGRHYTIKGLVSEPKPLQKPHPPIWVGGKGNMTLKIAALHADKVNFPMTSIEETSQLIKTFRAHCLKAGRRFEDIEKTWFGHIITDEREMEVKRKVLEFKDNSSNKFIRKASVDAFLGRNVIGVPDHCIEKIQRYIDLGIEYFVFHFPFPSDLKAQRYFIDNIASSFK